jgi:lariat debranching enzyme
METINKSIRIAVVGCLHGRLRDMYEDIKSNESETGKKVDFVICCGDFQVFFINIGNKRL